MSVNDGKPVTVPECQRVPLWDIAGTFLGIGLASFSLAALGETKKWMTEKRRWFTDEEYMQGLGLAQLMPGAPTVNLSAYLGFRLRGLLGAATATTFFLIPCFLLMLLLSYLYLEYGEMPVISGLFHGLGALVVGLVFNTILNLWRSGVRGIFNWLMAIVGFLMVFRFQMGVMQILIVAAIASTVVALLSRRFGNLSRWMGSWDDVWERGKVARNLLTSSAAEMESADGAAGKFNVQRAVLAKVRKLWGVSDRECAAVQNSDCVSACSRMPLPLRWTQIFRLIIWLSVILSLDLLLISFRPELLQMGRQFLRIGALVFGSGYAMLPFIQEAVVSRFRWLTDQQFGVALALSLITPGPVTIIGTFIGYKVAGLTGALVGMVNMYFPAWAMTTIVAAPYAKAGQAGYVKQVIGGIVAAFIGTLIIVLIKLAAVTLVDVPTIFMASAAFLVQRFVKIDTVWIVIGGAFLSLVIFR
ncbi:MAG: chromate transporter [Desulfomonilaceae bacterium]